MTPEERNLRARLAALVMDKVYLFEKIEDLTVKLERLGSGEAFDVARMMDDYHDCELKARMEFASDAAREARQPKGANHERRVHGAETREPCGCGEADTR
jgi:hypothetical protein